MRLLAANMQHRGFYRTPDEIKTRIRNLKCLYHRIKRSMQTGAGIGTVDPDWPHYKAMDEILTRKTNKTTLNLYKENVLEGPRCEDIKQEIIDDIDINDDMESFTTNSQGSDGDGEFEDESHPMPPLLAVAASKGDSEPLATVKIVPKPLSALQPKPAAVKPKVPNVPMTITQTTHGGAIRPPGGMAPAQTTLPFPLLILNGMPAAHGPQAMNALKKDGTSSGGNSGFVSQDVTNLLRNLVDVQKENLELEKQRLEVEKQKLDFQRIVGSELLTLLPMFRGLLQRLPVQHGNLEEDDIKEADAMTKRNGRKRPCPDNGLDILKDSKILRNVLEEGIKKYMMGDVKDEKSEKGDSSSDDASNCSSRK